MGLRVGTPMPSLDGATEWIGEQVSAGDLRGNLTLVHFWAVSCPFCKINLEHLERWRGEYGPRGVRFVAVHMPRGEADTNVEAVRQGALECRISEPCAVDNEHAIGNRFQSDAWPYYFLFDTEGKTRSRSAGEFGLKMAENSLKRLLQEQEAQ